VPEQTDKLTAATFVPPSKIRLVFADDQRFSLAIGRIGMPVDRIDWQTLKLSPGGETVVVKGIKGDAVPIDSGTLRYLVDKAYAAKIDESLERLQFSRRELEEMARDNPPPSEWYDVVEPDLTRESWK
jgi:hypothetical protein